VGATRTTAAAGPASLSRLCRHPPKIAPLLASVVALALGAASLAGQATVSAAGQLTATPVSKANCSSTRNGNEAVVDLESHKLFARLRTLCVGTLYGTGVIEAGALYVLRDVGPAQDSSFEVVRIDLSTYAVTRSAPIAGASWIFPGLGDIWVATNSSTLQLSQVSLRLLHSFTDLGEAGDFVPFAGRFWFLDSFNHSVKALNSLKTLDPTDGRVSVVSLPWLPTGLSPASIVSFGDELYLLLGSVQGTKFAPTAIATYDPVSGAHRVVRQPKFSGELGLLGVTGRVLWVEAYRAMFSEGVSAYSPQSLRPLSGGFVSGFFSGGSGTAVPDAGDLWFQLAGGPVECVSGRTGRLDAKLRLPYQNLTKATRQPQGFVAADASDLIVAATETRGLNPSESGVAVYKLDPRCRA